MPTKIVVPELGESVLEATVNRWTKQEGDRVSVGEVLLELETDKVDLEVGAEQDGVLARIEVQAGEDVKVGDVLGVIEELAVGESTAEEKQVSGQSDGAPREDRLETADQQVARPRESAEKATPVARRMAQTLGVALSEIEGSGPRGRVTKQDIQRASERSPAAGATRADPDQPLFSIAQRKEERVRMSRRRRTIAARLVEAQQTAAMLTTFNELDMGAVMDLRRRRKEAFREKHGVSLGLSSFFVKAAVGALKAFPRLNAEIDGDEMVLKQYFDIGVAIGAEEGLVVPVLRDVDRMSFAEIEGGIKDFAERAAQGALTLEDLQGGTFTITNGGVFGSLLSTPILNPPQVGILGLHKIEERPVAVDGKIEIRPMMYVALSYDHRIVDGREAVQFLVKIKELVEDPETLLLET